MCMMMVMLCAQGYSIQDAMALDVRVRAELCAIGYGGVHVLTCQVSDMLVTT
jgi:hypothetical protein